MPQLYQIPVHETTVCSITSMNIQKITLSYSSRNLALRALVNPEYRPTFNNCLCALAEKLYGFGNRQALGAELQTRRYDSEIPVDHNGFFPKLRERGWVRS